MLEPDRLQASELFLLFVWRLQTGLFISLFLSKNHNDSPAVSFSFFKCLTHHSWVKLSYLGYKYQYHPGLQWWSCLASLLGHLAVTANSTCANPFTYSPQSDFSNLAISVSIQRISPSATANPYWFHIFSARCDVGRVRTKVRKGIGHQTRDMKRKR